MDNPKILELLEKQRDTLYDKLKTTTISGLYMEQYTDIKSGRVLIFNNDERHLLVNSGYVDPPFWDVDPSFCNGVCVRTFMLG
jgi:hypothetical protein